MAFGSTDLWGILTENGGQWNVLPQVMIGRKVEQALKMSWQREYDRGRTVLCLFRRIPDIVGDEITNYSLHDSLFYFFFYKNITNRRTRRKKFPRDQNRKLDAVADGIFGCFITKHEKTPNRSSILSKFCPKINGTYKRNKELLPTIGAFLERKITSEERRRKKFL